MDSLRKPAIKRLSYKAGISYLGSTMYEELRYKIRDFIDKTISTTRVITAHRRSNRISANDVSKALTQLGRTPYHRTCKQVNTRYMNKNVAANLRQNGQNVIATRVNTTCPGKVTKKCKELKPSNNGDRAYKGERAHQQVKLAQAQPECFAIPKKSFSDIVRHISAARGGSVQISPEALTMIQTDTENYFVDCLKRAHQIAKTTSNNRTIDVIVMFKHFALALNLGENTFSS